MKACLIRLGVRNFKPTLRQASERLEMVRTPEGAPLPLNTLAEMRRDMARLRLVREQIREIEAARSQRLQVSESRAHAMVKLLTGIIGVGIETADMLVHEILSRQLRDRRAVARYAAHPMRADGVGGRRGLHAPAMPGSGVG
jgi:transposase